MNKTHLQELNTLLGCDPQGLRPRLFEAADIEDQDSAEAAAFEKEFSRAAGVALKRFTGLDFPTATSSGTIKITSIRGLAVDPNSEELEVVAPLFVTYTGKAAPNEWASAEKAYEQQIADVIKSVAQQFMEEPKIKFLRRKKTDPFKNDPRSLTLLRYRVQ